MLAILTQIGISDVLDIFFISFVAYHLYVWFSGTKAFKALVGIVVLSGVYLVADTWGLFLTTWVFQILWQVFVILLVILFQQEIRQMLERFNPLKKFTYKKGQKTEKWVTDLAQWAFDAASKRTGALIVFERSDMVFDLITKGTAMGTDPVPEILTSIFMKESPLHDGASLISKGKLLKASCFLPLTIQENLPRAWGTRHRAALGLTEQSDACALIVSEERGQVSFAMGSEIERIPNADYLEKVLSKHVLLSKGENRVSVRGKIKSWFTVRFPVKATVFSIVFILWLAFAGQQNFEKQFDVALELNHVPADLKVVEANGPPTVKVICRGLRKDVTLLTGETIRASLNLFAARTGTHPYPVNIGNIILPNDRIRVVNVIPAGVELTFQQKAE